MLLIITHAVVMY